GRPSPRRLRQVRNQRGAKSAVPSFSARNADNRRSFFLALQPFHNAVGIGRDFRLRMPGSEEELHPAPDYAPRNSGSARLEGKVAIITDGDFGIDRASAFLFAHEGDCLVN
ncbi:MAG: hypothetical protein RLN84_14495, partial [Rhodospirillaceae bacterium]